tara:strand:+ start:108 stop:215 length:108 start_codon:yes stop_codon:yes gene_type:complete
MKKIGFRENKSKHVKPIRKISSIKQADYVLLKGKC